jgi:excisionase family DNA binding protein
MHTSTFINIEIQSPPTWAVEASPEPCFKLGAPMTQPLSGNPLASPAGLTDEPLWTVDEVARYLRLEPNTVRHLARLGKLPGVKVNRMWRFDKASIDASLRRCGEAAAEGDPAHASQR